MVRRKKSEALRCAAALSLTALFGSSTLSGNPACGLLAVTGIRDGDAPC